MTGVPADQAKDRLSEDGISVSITVPEHNQFDTGLRGVHPLIRFSPHYYNTEEEIDLTLDAVARLSS